MHMTIRGAQVFLGSFLGAVLAYGIVSKMLFAHTVTVETAFQGTIFAGIAAVVSTAIDLIFDQTSRQKKQSAANDL